LALAEVVSYKLHQDEQQRILYRVKPNWIDWKYVTSLQTIARTIDYAARNRSNVDMLT
jgi:hypothetical protein